ncbi:MAG: TRAP transporter substrate-binding protein DctP [Candidatus Calescibacterium sp.]|nr:TRAP transporter substrate-binding protein DctP [Candidatus Calescibacterium sp.]MCX7734413.1 TRAP transporter substrate-binding protein DctP [bacterium]MDW8086821.1 TRAP transporter substrate-binding protein DctP [Candidatus Calescibacterium sp.]
MRTIEKQNTSRKATIKCMASVIILFSLILSTVFVKPSYSDEIVIKAGSLAPAASVWMQLWNDTAQKVKERIKNLKITTYPGGVMGDEEEMIRKIRIGQLHVGAFTIKGIKKIAPEVGVLDVPFLFRNYREVDHITSKFRKEFSDYFEKNGFKILVFAEQGFVYYYSKNPNITSYRDLGKTRVWAWKDERIMINVAKILGTSPIYIAVPDVLSALETGMLESLQTSPVACLSLQWCKLMKVIIDYPYRYEPGVVVIYKKVWDGLPEDVKKAFESVIKEEEPLYNKKIREAQENAKQKLREMGVKFVKPSEEDLKWFEAEVKQKLWYSADAEYPQDLLRKISQELENFRK